MSHPKIECYLCGSEATLLEPDTSRDKIVECGSCANRYRLTSFALTFFFEREDGKEILNDSDKEKLSRYVYENVVLIDPDVIKKVTGKESVGFGRS